MDFREKHQHCKYHEAQLKGHPKKLKPVADRDERSVMHVFLKKRKSSCFFLTLIKRKVVRRMSLYCQPCMIMSKSRKTSERNPAYT